MIDARNESLIRRRDPRIPATRTVSRGSTGPEVIAARQPDRRRAARRRAPTGMPGVRGEVGKIRKPVPEVLVEAVEHLAVDVLPNHVRRNPFLGGARPYRFVAVAPVLFVIAVAVTVVDQGAKALVTRRLRLGCPLNVAARCGLRRAENPAGAFIGASPAQAATLWLAGVGAAIALTALGPALPGAGAVAVGLVIGGATGNLVDRVFRGAVVDFVAIGRWPSFNVADAALVVGAVIAPLSVI